MSASSAADVLEHELARVRGEQRELPLLVLGAEALRVVGTTKPRMPFTSPSSPVCAQTTATSAMEPLVIHILVPFSTQPSRLLARRGDHAAGLEP
jgi:hypothetical protein